MRRLFIILFCFAGINASAQFKNIKLAEESEGGRLPMTPSIAISQKDPKVIVAGIGPDLVKYTLDGGGTWNEQVLSSTFGAAGNPSVISDAKGDIYYLHGADPSNQGSGAETWLDRIVCQKSEDGGKSWSKGSFFGNNPPKDQGKEHAAVHPKKQIIYTTWTQFDSYGSKDQNCHCNILFSMSTNAGSKWEKPVQLNQTSGNCLEGGNIISGAPPAVAMDGRIFVSWSSHGVIFFDRSYDGGETWLTNDIGIAKQAASGLAKIPGIANNPGVPVLMVNNSETRAHNNLYIVYADTKNGENDSDIWFIRSVNRGDNWTMPLRINSDEPGRHQFMPWMTVDQSTGSIYIIYYDRRAYDDLQTDVYLAYSVDGGNTFSEAKLSETPFIPTDSKPFSEYNGVVAYDGLITAVWTRMDNGKTSTWAALVKEGDLPKVKKDADKKDAVKKN